MHTALRPYATAGVALVGAGLIAVGPVTPTPHAFVVRDADVALTGSVANIPANAFMAALNTPANLVFGIQRFADAMAESGSWEVSQPNNVWGWDPANPEMLEGFVDMLVPFPALSRPLGEHLNWWAAANLPMHEGCAFECTDPIGMLQSMFTVPMWKFYSPEGYTFGEVINPVDGKPTEWSGKTIKLDRFEVIKSVADYFTGEPQAFRPVTMYDFVTASANLAAALQVTGHVPDWLAVREIETFVKLFIPKPENPAVEDKDYPDNPTGWPGGAPETATTTLVGLDTLKVAKTEVQAPAQTAAPTPAVTTEPVVETTVKATEKVTEKAAEEAEATEAPDTAEESSDKADASTGGQSGRKGTFSVKDTVASLQKKFESAKQQAEDSASERKSARAEKNADRQAKSTAGTSASSKADKGSGSSDSGGGDSGGSD
ncbi:hypothetical protein [Mycobacterium sp. PSTR-4-N]|uniref:hypothetical protein n=1 Tax=Mycobacterium sp. PSTR-4-N TaxID=2917745 RepID=UPI001F1501D7|nr:hypothetical protein [Mycobacterium sp. PSTR-4-N]MCG7596670.1 hypothetical protein [Mycobacterium sp. PSTR-4-N]